MPGSHNQIERVKSRWQYQERIKKKRRYSDAPTREHGEDALIHAAMRHDELLEGDDVDGVMVRGRVVRVIREMCAEVGREGATVH